MIEAAERAGLLQPGGTIIEPTSGNTGHGLAIAAALRGYRCIFVMADKQSAEKQALLRAYGAEVVLCPSNVAPESPESYYSVATRLARDIPGAYKPDQYWNMENPLAHERTTGPEIWEQTGGRVTHLLSSVGTGGTVSGITHFLKGRNPAIRVIGADPEGSVLSGDVARPYLTEGVGEDFLPGTYDPATVDRWVRVSDRDAFAMARRITREEGILSGGSCGTAMVAALDEMARLVREEPATAAGAVVVVILPDGGRNYLSKLYSDEWLRANGLLATTGASARVGELLADRHHGPDLPEVILARTTDRVSAAIDLLQLYGISQLPVSEQTAGDDLVGIVGSVSEKGLLERVYRNPEIVRSDDGRGHGPSPADARRDRDGGRGVPAAVRRRGRAAGRAPRASGRRRHEARPPGVPGAPAGVGRASRASALRPPQSGATVVSATAGAPSSAASRSRVDSGLATNRAPRLTTRSRSSVSAV